MTRSHFIKLTSIVINSLKIKKIQIENNKYCIHLINNKIDGFFLIFKRTYYFDK